MPTGYTAIIEDGCTFAEYLWRCARGMSANIMMREEPLNVRIKPYEPSDWYRERLEAERAELAKLEAMSPEEAIADEQKAFEQTSSVGKELTAASSALLDKYLDMRMKVEAWTPPTKDHVGLKSFMLEQIDMCMKHESVRMPEPAPAIDREGWLRRHADRITVCKKSIDYFIAEREKEIIRVQERNAWNAALEASVPQPKPR